MSGLAGAEIIVLGGGAVGCGVAYSLARAGKTDVLVIEKGAELGSVTTSQGAGLAGQVRSTAERTRVAMDSVAAFEELEGTSPVKPGWRRVGSLRIAQTDERAAEFRRLAGVAGKAGLEVEILDARKAQALWPPLDLRAAKAVLWCPSDGYMSPRDVVRSYEHACRAAGVRFATSTRVEGIVLEGGRVAAVDTDRGRLDCRWAVNAAGAHAHHIARLAGLELPIVPVRHEYFVSVPLPGIHPGLPCLRIPDASLYARPSEDSLLLGGWEEESVDTDPRAYPITGEPPAIDPDRKVLSSFARRFAPFFPAVEGAATKRVGKGWPTFTPDGHFIVGESRRVPGFVMAGGCNAHGISGSVGIGRLVAESILSPEPSPRARSLSPDRFTESDWDWEEARSRARKVYEAYYGLESC
jgi:glycine/D-amino acid oxidase-like deaminating enzyme